MSPEQTVQLKDIADIRGAVDQYIRDNVGLRAEDRDLAWSHRYLVAKLSLLQGQTMPFAQLTEEVANALSETSSELTRFLTAELIAEKLCTQAEAPEQVGP